MPLYRRRIAQIIEFDHITQRWKVTMMHPGSCEACISKRWCTECANVFLISCKMIVAKILLFGSVQCLSVIMK